MQEQPKVSVIVPVYNGEKFLSKSVESVLTQSFRDFELILMNDGSKDNSLTYLQSLKDPRVRVVDQENMGLVATLNKALGLAKADIIVRLDQDDICKPERIERQYKAMEEHQLDVLFTMIEKFGAKNSWSNRDTQREKEGEVEILKNYMYGTFLHSTMMAKKDVLLKMPYRREYYPCDDMDLQIRLEENYRVGILKEKLVLYRFHNEANTYPYFFTMQEKRRWCEHNAQLRSEGKEEISLTTYRVLEQNHRIWLNRKRKDFYAYHVRRGGDSYLQGDYLGMLKHMGIGFMIGPERLIMRLLGRRRQC